MERDRICVPECSPAALELVLRAADGCQILRCRFCGTAVKIADGRRLRPGEARGETRFSREEYETAVVLG